MTIPSLSIPVSNPPFVPPPVQRIEDTGLSPLWLQDHILKVMYFQGYLTGFKIAEEIALPFTGVVDLLLEALKREKLVEIRQSQIGGLGEGAYQYGITGLANFTSARGLGTQPVCGSGARFPGKI